LESIKKTKNEDTDQQQLSNSPLFFTFLLFIRERDTIKYWRDGEDSYTVMGLEEFRNLPFILKKPEVLPAIIQATNTYSLHLWNNETNTVSLVFVKENIDNKKIKNNIVREELNKFITNPHYEHKSNEELKQAKKKTLDTIVIPKGIFNIKLF
jgi:hypothetical protein